jgi:hypothetical protein
MKLAGCFGLSHAGLPKAHDALRQHTAQRVLNRALGWQGSEKGQANLAIGLAPEQRAWNQRLL